MKTDWLSIGAISLGVGAALSAFIGDSVESAIQLSGMWVVMAVNNLSNSIKTK